MADSFKRLAMHLQEALDHHQAEEGKKETAEHKQLGLALRAAIATMHQAAAEFAAKTSALDLESAEVLRLTTELQAKAKRKNGAK